MTRAQVNMSPHGGARWAREKGRGYTFQWESSFQKAANVPLEESVGQLTAVIARAETKGGQSMLSSGGRRIYVWVRPDIQVHCAEVCGNLCLIEKEEEEEANKPARGSQVAVRTRTEDHNKEHQANPGPQRPTPVNMSVESYSSLDESSLRALVSAWMEMQLDHWCSLTGNSGTGQQTLIRHPQEKWKFRKILSAHPVKLTVASNSLS